MDDRSMQEAGSRPEPGRGCGQGLAAWCRLVIPLLFFWLAADEDLAARPSRTNVVQILSTNGVVEVRRSGASVWDFASTAPDKGRLFAGDQLRTGPDSRATVRLADRTLARIGAQGQLTVLESAAHASGLRVLRGRFFFLHRDRPGRVRVQTPTVLAGIRGTEFFVGVDPADGTTRIQLYDGALTLTNRFGVLALQGRAAATIVADTRPQPAPHLPAVNVLQWTLYYPAVLVPEELPWHGSMPPDLGRSMRAYRQGDLRQAHALYPSGRPPGSPAESLYRAALSLGIGDVDDALRRLQALGEETVGPVQVLKNALERLVAAVKFQVEDGEVEPSSATSLLAGSYEAQSRADLDTALDRARAAVDLAPGFGMAWARQAELEFAFGRADQAEALLQRALVLSPRHADAVSLHGFLLAARGRTREAVAAFDRAIDLDAGLANAWLGRGLCRIRLGNEEAGQEDLLMAAAIEPQRSILRSYLGKALALGGDAGRALHELDLARRLDPNDPTAWLYAALLQQQENGINQAIADLEKAQSLNDNRALFRSRQLLDQDRAIRGANLANLYQDAGMEEVAYREAVRAVYEDYSSFSSHLFLANSFDLRRDQRQVNLRFETPWFSEFLIANLLAPVGAGTLSQRVSREEYSRLFERTGAGVVSRTEYLSNGDWLQGGAVHGRWDGIALAVEELYQKENGFRPNGDLESLTLSAQAKLQLDMQNSLFVQAIRYDAEGGDLVPHYSKTGVNRGLAVEESQEPILLLGYHHEWTPAIHTLVLGGRLEASRAVRNPAQGNLLFWQDDVGTVTNVNQFALPLDHTIDLELWSAEAQQIVGQGRHQVVVGARGQVGKYEAASLMPGTLFLPETRERVDAEFERLSAYVYHHWRVVDRLQLLAGVSYDRMTHPVNYRRPPIADRRETADQWSPKAGLVWSPSAGTTFRAAYARALGGISLDQSVRLEPSHLAGFVQAYRNLIPEPVAGPVPAEEAEIIGAAWDQRFPTRTYVGLMAEWLQSEAERNDGVFVRSGPASPGGPISVGTALALERLDYEERNVTATVHQLVGDIWSLGAVYRWSDAALDQGFPQVASGTPAFGGFAARRRLEATLQQLRLFALVNLPTGWFAQAEGIYSRQSNRGYSPDLPGDEFWHLNGRVGYRFPRRRAELSVGLLNVTDRDYKLNPMNLTRDLPRERTFVARFRFAF